MNDTAPVVNVSAEYLAELEAQAAEVAQLRDRALRSAADFDNFRKRATREKEDAAKFASESLLNDLLPVIDSFDLGLESAANASDAKAVASGMQMAVAQLLGVLQQNGIEWIDARGQMFDPNLHEALAQQESADVPEGTVLHQMRRGCRLRGRLLRPAAVVVAKAPGA